MKHYKYIMIIILIFSFALFSCKKTITEPDDSTIVGKWQISGLANKWIITTTSDQLVKKPYSGDGQITSFGAYNSVFNGLMLLSSDPFVIAAVELDYGMVLTDAIVIDGATGIGTTSNSNTNQTFKGVVKYIFNGTTLIITESVLTNPQNATETVTVNGSLSFATENVPANTQTLVNAPDIWMLYYYSGPYTTEFLDNGSVVRSNSSAQGSVEENGTWSLNNDILTIDINSGNNTSTDIYNVNIDGNTLVIKESFDICSGEENTVECLNEYEQLFGIDAGSLSELGVEVTSIFNKIN